VSDEEAESRQVHPDLRTTRMEAFSDGVFAIAITLLVLELKVPPESDHPVLNAVAREWPTYLAYLVSFASIGAAWLSHSTITEYLERADSVLLRLNLLLLFFVSLLPFPTHMLSEYLHDIPAERVAVTIYGLNLIAMVALTSILWRYAVAEKLIKPDLDDEELRMLTRKLEPGLIGYAVAIAIGMLLPRAAVALYFLIGLFLLIPFRVLLRHGWRGRKRSSAD
jgi:uncharacterized membrane protein